MPTSLHRPWASLGLKHQQNSSPNPPFVSSQFFSGQSHEMLLRLLCIGRILGDHLNHCGANTPNVAGGSGWTHPLALEMKGWEVCQNMPRKGMHLRVLFKLTMIEMYFTWLSSNPMINSQSHIQNCRSFHCWIAVIRPPELVVMCWCLWRLKATQITRFLSRSPHMFRSESIQSVVPVASMVYVGIFHP